MGHSGSWAFVAHVFPQFWCDVTLHVSPEVYDNVPLFIFIFVRRANRWREGSLIFFLSYNFTVIKCMISGHKQTLSMKRSSVLNIKHMEQDCDCGSLYILQLWDRFVGVNPAAFSLFRFEKIFIDCVTLFSGTFFCNEAAQTESMCCPAVAVCWREAVWQLCLCNADQLRPWNE